MSNRVSGLSDDHAHKARLVLVEGAHLLLAHKDDVHYTQDSVARWEGIHQKLRVVKHEFPRHGDCSSTDTWLLWNGLTHVGAHADTVNGLDWGGGYTGTILRHGKHVEHQGNWMVGDELVYGVRGTTGEHTALYLGGGYVFSHGSEGGPYKLLWNYRGDLMEVRRAI